VEMVDGATGGMGGPAHKPVEPASAPKPAAKPAKAPKVEAEASTKPQQQSAAAS